MLAWTYIDNVIVFGRDASGAEAAMAWMRQQLRMIWSAEVPESYLEVLAPRGAAVFPSLCRRVVHMKCLGHWISDGGGVMRCWRTARAAVRAVVLRVKRALRASSVPWKAKVRFLASCVFLIVMYRAPCLLEQIDGLHSWAVAIATDSRPWPVEVAGVFLRRRATAVARLVAPGTQDQRASKGTRALHEPMCSCFPAALSPAQSAEWVLPMGLAAGSASVFLGCVDAGVAGGRVSPRWVKFAAAAPR